MDNTAVVVESLSHTGPLHYSYNELISRSQELASVIQRLTASTLRTTHIGVFCGNSFELVLSLLSILSISYAYVPLTPHNLELITNLHIPLVLVRAELLTQYLLLATEPTELETQCFNSGVVICRYGSTHTEEHIPYSSPGQSTSLYDLFSRSARHHFAPPVERPSQSSQRTAYVLQSSGTTGHPKTIRVPHSALIPNILDLSRTFSLSPTDTCFLSAPPTFDPSLVQILTSLTSGSTLLIAPPAPCTTYPDLFTRHNLTVLQCTPSLLYTFSLSQCMLLLAPTSPLRVLAFGGENCPPVSLLRRWKHPNNCTHLYNLYGITEVSCWSTCHRIQLHTHTEWEHLNSSTEDVLREFGDVSVLSDLVSIGTPLSDTRVELREERPGNLLGEIWVGGASRLCGVGGDQGEEMRNTGDVGIRGGEGSIYCLGRRDTQLKRLGHRIDLLNVERCVRAVPGVESCVVRREKGRILAFLVIGSDWIAVRKRIQTDIPSKHRPDLIKILPTIPLTPHGKLDTHSLLPASSHPSTAPTLPQAVRDFFSEELSLLSLAPSPLPLSKLGVDSFELVSIATRLQDLASRYSQHLNIESLYDFLSSLPSDSLPDSVIQRIESCGEEEVPVTKRSRVDLTPATTLPQLPDSIVYLRRGTVSCSLDTFPSSLLPPPDPLRMSLTWSHDMGQCVDSSPLLCYHPLSHELILYVGSHSRNFSALRASDGVPVWSTDLDDRVESSAALSHCGRFLAVGSYSGGVWVLEREGGGVHWVFSTGSEPVKSSPCADPSTGLVWVGTHSSTLVALDLIKKECAFRVDTGSGSCYSSPVVDPVLGAVYVGTHGGDLLNVSGSDGSIRWRCRFKKPLFSSPVLLPDHGLVVGSVGGGLYSVSAEGVVRWRYEVEAPIFSSACVLQLPQALHLFIGTYNRRVLSLNSEGGLEWEYITDSDIFSIPFALPCCHTVNTPQSGIIVVAMNNGTVLLLNFAAVRLCSYKLPSEVFSSPVMAGNRVFVGCRDNCVYCLDMT